MSGFLVYQNDALKKELKELKNLAEHSSEIINTFLDKSSELDYEDRKYVSLINKELRNKLNKLNYLSDGE
jgi:hypothetical protein|tara:strand:- start:1055 stop:1264 length:210 start_codon:yes stop_codon:yes gene_type:complete